jgi:hypothetical protein
MNRVIKILGICAIAAFIFTGCTKENPLGFSDDITPAHEVDGSALLALPGNATPQPAQAVKGNKDKVPAIWGDCQLFATIGTTTSFKPTAGNFDELYNGANFKNGVGAVSESKPGDQDFNGGRWHVNTLKAGVDPDKYNNVCRVEDIDHADFVSTSTYFECPMLPLH